MADAAVQALKEAGANVRVFGFEAVGHYTAGNVDESELLAVDLHRVGGMTIAEVVKSLDLPPIDGQDVEPCSTFTKGDAVGRFEKAGRPTRVSGGWPGSSSAATTAT